MSQSTKSPCSLPSFITTIPSISPPSPSPSPLVTFRAVSSPHTPTSPITPDSISPLSTLPPPTPPSSPPLSPSTPSLHLSVSPAFQLSLSSPQSASSCPPSSLPPWTHPSIHPTPPRVHRRTFNYMLCGGMGGEAEIVKSEKCEIVGSMFGGCGFVWQDVMESVCVSQRERCICPVVEQGEMRESLIIFGNREKKGRIEQKEADGSVELCDKKAVKCMEKALGSLLTVRKHVCLYMLYPLILFFLSLLLCRHLYSFISSSSSSFSYTSSLLSHYSRITRHHLTDNAKSTTAASTTGDDVVTCVVHPDTTTAANMSTAARCTATSPPPSAGTIPIIPHQTDCADRTANSSSWNNCWTFQGCCLYSGHSERHSHSSMSATADQLHRGGFFAGRVADAVYLLARPVVAAVCPDEEGQCQGGGVGDVKGGRKPPPSTVGGQAEVVVIHTAGVKHLVEAGTTTANVSGGAMTDRRTLAATTQRAVSAGSHDSMRDTVAKTSATAITALREQPTSSNTADLGYTKSSTTHKTGDSLYRPSMTGDRLYSDRIIYLPPISRDIKTHSQSFYVTKQWLYSDAAPKQPLPPKTLYKANQHSTTSPPLPLFTAPISRGCGCVSAVPSIAEGEEERSGGTLGMYEWEARWGCGVEGLWGSSVLSAVLLRMVQFIIDSACVDEPRVGQGGGGGGSADKYPLPLLSSLLSCHLSSPKECLSDSDGRSSCSVSCNDQTQPQQQYQYHQQDGGEDVLYLLKMSASVGDNAGNVNRVYGGGSRYGEMVRRFALHSGTVDAA
eukprot:GHVQ01033833.1.p1 GENE.GHVQ01033833.1~~GHVQ01033833.1.p1  ORF type:complete len:851 (+),score=217.93 GHVQ01033833.1:202-2553(+)